MTALPLAREALQLEPQLMPAGDELTVPEPALLTVKVRVTEAVVDDAVKVAETAEFAFTVTLHAPVPVQAPVQPLKV